MVAERSWFSERGWRWWLIALLLVGLALLGATAVLADSLQSVKVSGREIFPGFNEDECDKFKEE